MTLIDSQFKLFAAGIAQLPELARVDPNAVAAAEHHVQAEQHILNHLTASICTSFGEVAIGSGAQEVMLMQPTLDGQQFVASPATAYSTLIRTETHRHDGPAHRLEVHFVDDDPRHRFLSEEALTHIGRDALGKPRIAEYTGNDNFIG
jgi:hypothetical protein